MLIDDLLAGVRTTAELNAMIREGLAAARRGEADGLGNLGTLGGKSLCDRRDSAVQ